MAEKQNWRGPLVLALVGIIGAWLGSAVQNFLTLKRERSNALEERQSAAFVDFLSAFEKSRMARQWQEAGDGDKAIALENEYQLEAGAAQRRIAVFGDQKVVEAMAGWFRSYTQRPLPRCDEKLSAEFTLWRRMREAVLSSDDSVSLNDLAEITTHCKPALGQ
jgi:hypothetical protein